MGAEQRKEIQAKAIERAKEQIKETRGQLYDKFIESGDSAEIASEKAQTLVPDYEVIKKDVEELVREGFGEDEKENLKQAYVEATSVANEDADKYILMKDEIKSLIEKAGKDEQEADETARMMTSIAINSYQIAKEQGVDIDFDKIKNEVFKLNNIINYAQNKPISETEQEDIWREVERERVVELQEGIDRYMDESQGGVLFSKTEDEIKLEEIQQKAFAKDVQTVIKEAKRDKPSNKVKAGFGKVSKWLDVVSSRVGLNISGYKHVVDAQGIRHIYNRHGEGNEAVVNQIPITDKDIEVIPSVVHTPNFIVYGTKTDKGLDGIGYLKTMTDGTTYYVEEVRDEDEQLAAKTLYKIEGVTAESLIEESRRPTSETAPSAVRLVQKLKSATVIPAFTESISSGNTNVKRVDEDGKLYSINERGEERPYSNKELDKMLDNAEENKEALIDLYYNHRHKYLGRNGDRLETQVTNKYIGWGLEESNWSKERRRARWETEARINDLKRRMANLKIPRELSPSALYRIFENSGYKILREYEANTGSYYLTVENPIEGEEDIHISIRDHWQHSADYVEPDYDIYIDRDYNWTRTILYMADELGLKDTLITKLRKYNDLKNELLGTEGIYYSQTEGEILGSYDMAKREVELFKGHNPSTLTHELGHHFIISHLNFMESIGANDKNKPVFEFLSGLANREINSVRDMERADHENLVEAFIDYMNIGQAPNIVTGNIFQRAKNWF